MPLYFTEEDKEMLDGGTLISSMKTQNQHLQLALKAAAKYTLLSFLSILLYFFHCLFASFLNLSFY